MGLGFGLGFGFGRESQGSGGVWCRLLVRKREYVVQSEMIPFPRGSNKHLAASDSEIPHLCGVVHDLIGEIAHIAAQLGGNGLPLDPPDNRASIDGRNLAERNFLPDNVEKLGDGETWAIVSTPCLASHVRVKDV